VAMYHSRQIVIFQSALDASSIPFSVITKYSFDSGMHGGSIIVASLVPPLPFSNVQSMGACMG
jgi:hypothetical protein